GAAQPGLRSVEGELTDWMGRVLRLSEPPRLTCAGRTDAGVHARGQVVHVDLPAMSPTGRAGLQDTGLVLARRLPRALPDDLAVRRVTRAPKGFDARFSAIWRRYVYRLWDAPEDLDPLRRHHVVRHPDPLEMYLLAQSGTDLLGLHDFAAFCKRRDGATTIRTLQRVTAVRQPDRTIEVTVQADAFCHSMVRSLMGALTAVAAGRRDRAWLRSLLTHSERAGEVAVLPAHGLTLEEVGYPADSGLAARAAESRATRSLDEDT
ncbi:MAG: tRNA pseudouridine(38-40) synthase TruA, partial [Actinobacteria bacterium]|nr:tRNA pseudouridine(38-40) synthase TruA [Actinomycetota bacterium]